MDKALSIVNDLNSAELKEGLKTMVKGIGIFLEGFKAIDKLSPDARETFIAIMANLVVKRSNL